MKWLPALLLAFAARAVAAERSFTIGGEPFAQVEIVDARAQPDIAGNAAILITFSEGASPRLAALTRKLLNQQTPVVLDGKTLASPLVQEAIEGGTIQIVGNFALVEAEALAKAISGKDPLPETLDD